MTGADIATSADVEHVLAELRAQRVLIESLASRLPDQWLPLKIAADKDHCDCDPRTLVSAGERGEITIRRLGRRVLVLASSLRPIDRAVVATLAREARRG